MIPYEKCQTNKTNGRVEGERLGKEGLPRLQLWEEFKFSEPEGVHKSKERREILDSKERIIKLMVKKDWKRLTWSIPTLKQH